MGGSATSMETQGTPEYYLFLFFLHTFTLGNVYGAGIPNTM
jgi:hypothetical protein